MSESELTFETEGDIREYVQSNPDEAVKLVNSGGEPVWFRIDDDGEFGTVLVWDDGTVERGPLMGDGYTLGEYELDEVTDAAHVPQPE